jgi:hypothetical protein
MKEALAKLAEELDKMSNGRKTRPPYFRVACRLLGDRVRAGLDAASLGTPDPNEPSLNRLRALWTACVAWRDKMDPSCREDIFQCDRVALSCPGLAGDVMDVVGYAPHCDICGEKSDSTNLCEKCTRETKETAS